VLKGPEKSQNLLLSFEWEHRINVELSDLDFVNYLDWSAWFVESELIACCDICCMYLFSF